MIIRKEKAMSLLFFVRKIISAYKERVLYRNETRC